MDDKRDSNSEGSHLIATKSFIDVGAYGVESRVSLQSTDGEKWIRTQVRLLNSFMQ